jgi:hypothetical protein
MIIRNLTMPFVAICAANYDSATWYSFHTCSTLVKFKSLYDIFTYEICLFMIPIHAWCYRMPLELEFTDLILQILYWIYELANAIHIRVFLLDLPKNTV